MRDQTSWPVARNHTIKDMHKRKKFKIPVNVLFNIAWISLLILTRDEKEKTLEEDKFMDVPKISLKNKEAYEKHKTVLLGQNIVDLSSMTKDVKVFSKKKNKYVLVRESDTSSKPKKYLMLHQTDGAHCPNVNNWISVKSQIGVPCDGPIILIHPLASDVIGTYPSMISVEVSGKFPALVTQGQYATMSRKLKFDELHKDTLTEFQKRGIETAIDLFIAFGASNGMKASELQLIGHFMTYASRVFDPGKEIWQHGARYAILKGMSVDENFKMDSGLSTHDEWRVT